MFSFLKRIFSRKARSQARWKARLEGIDVSKFAICVECEDPIVPGDFIGMCHVGLNPNPQMIHAGFHDTATEKDAFCETAAIGIGYWDGEKIIGSRESTALKAMRTGEAQFGKY